jgi:formamidase
MLAREHALADAGGSVARPYAKHASPASVCGPGGSHADECLRTITPREHGGNLDIRYLRPGVTVYLPCQVNGCGLALGDFHFAQGDGEVSGAALEMDATIVISVEIIDNPPALDRGPHFAGDSTLLDIPSTRFYATTGFPLKSNGAVPSRLAYLGSEKYSSLDNLSGDLTVAARNALLAMIDYIVESRGYTREQAYIISSIAVDLRFGQVVDLPNVGVTAVLPLDIFVGDADERNQTSD